MNIVGAIANEINIRAFERKTQRVLRLISILECGSFTKDELMSRMDVSQATLYRLFSFVSDVLWNYEVVNDEGRYFLTQRQYDD